MTVSQLIENAESHSNQGAFIFIGQAGCQIGSALWMLYNAEHYLQSDGFGISESMNKAEHIDFYKDSIFYKEDEFHREFCYFELPKNGKFVPRTLFIDLEPTVIDEIRTGSYRNLFDPRWSLREYSKVGDGSGIFPRAYNTIGRCVISNVMDSVRYIAEKCSRLTVLNIARSYGGATGSGLGSLILEKLHDTYDKVMLSESNILNSDCCTSPTVEPYNTILGIESSCTSGGVTFLYSNKALKEICYQKLSIKKPSYYHINQLLCHGISGIYSSERFPGHGSCNLDTILTNLIPYPRIQFTTSSIAPIISKKIMKYEPFHKPVNIINDVLSNDHAMFTLDMDTGSYISCCMIYRGLVSPSSVATSHSLVMNEKRIKMIEWSPTGIKSGHSPLNIIDIPGFEVGISEFSIMMLANHTNISDSLAKDCFAVHTMLKKKAFLHWYLEHGMEENDLHSALENAMLLTLDYREIHKSPETAIKLFQQETAYKTEESISKTGKKPISADKVKFEKIGMFSSQKSKLKFLPDKSEKETHSNIKSSDRFQGKHSNESSMLLDTFGSLEGNETMNENVLREMIYTLTTNEKKDIIAIARSLGIDVEYILNLDDPGVELTYEMLRTVKMLQDISNLQMKTNLSSVVENALINGIGNEKVDASVVKKIIDTLTAQEKRELLAIARSNGINALFLDNLEDPGFELTQEMLHNLDKLIKIKKNQLITLASSTIDDTFDDGEGNVEEIADSMREILEALTPKDKEKMIAFAKSRGIDTSFLEKCDDPDFVVTKEMLESLRTLLFQSNFNLQSKASSSSENVDLSTKLHTNVSGNRIDALTAEEKNRIIAKANLLGIDVSFLDHCGEPGFKFTMEMLQTVGALLEDKHVQPISADILKGQRRSFAVASIERSKVCSEPVKITQYPARSAISMGNTYDESYTKCIKPSSSMANLIYFYKLFFEAHAAKPAVHHLSLSRSVSSQF